MGIAYLSYAQEEEPNYIDLSYKGEQYLRISLTDKAGTLLFNRKLSKKQSINVPLYNAKGKLRKQIRFKVGERHMLFKVACSKKDRAKQLGLDIFAFSYSPAFAKKPPCFVKDDGAEVNLAPVAQING